MAQLTAKKIIQYGSIIIVLFGIIGYGIWQSRDILFGITDTVTGITDGASQEEPILDFGGTAYHASTITVNGRIVPLAENGIWHDTLALLPGYNTIEIRVTDRFKRTKTKIYHLYYKQHSKSLLIINRQG